MKNTSFMRSWTEGTLHPDQKTCRVDQCCLLSLVFSSQKQGVAPSFMEKRRKFRQSISLHELTVFPHRIQCTRHQGTDRQDMVGKLSVDGMMPSFPPWEKATAADADRKWHVSGSRAQWQPTDFFLSFFFWHRWSLFLWEQDRLCVWM